MHGLGSLDLDLGLGRICPASNFISVMSRNGKLTDSKDPERWLDTNTKFYHDIALARSQQNLSYIGRDRRIGQEEIIELFSELCEVWNQLAG